MTDMKGTFTHDAELQPTRDFEDRDGTANEKFLEFIKAVKILQIYGKIKLLSVTTQEEGYTMTNKLFRQAWQDYWSYIVCS